jgi:hypothetical protein
MSTQAIAEQILADSRRSSKMTGSRIAHLRSIAERDKSAKLAEARFVETFSRVPNEVTAYREVLRRITKRRYDHEGDFGKLHKKEQERIREELRLLPRRAEKLQLALKLGLRPTSVHDVLFLSELTPDEARLSDSKWEQFLEEGRKRKPIVPARQVEIRRCQRGSKCLFAVRRQPAEIKGSGNYCSTLCRDSRRACQRRKNA